MSKNYTFESELVYFLKYKSKCPSPPSSVNVTSYYSYYLKQYEGLISTVEYVGLLWMVLKKIKKFHIENYSGMTISL